VGVFESLLVKIDKKCVYICVKYVYCVVGQRKDVTT
jgi:hypothetical protein